ncbi:MAG: fasciclin domain-containing protein [Candidatus Poseidoniaceae archaeon]
MNRVLTFMLMILLVASAFPLNATADASDDIPTNAAGTGVHGSLLAALTHVGLNTTLEGTGPFTLFAPTDQAFDDAGIDLANFQTQEEKDMLTDILLYHVVTASVASSAVTDGMIATMANGDKAKFTVNGATVSIGTATVTTADVQSSNGIIHVIDQVLMPPQDIPATASLTGIHNSLVSAVLQADLLPTLEGPGPFTVFAPTDQAFAEAGIDLAALDNPQGKAILEDILLYHVVSEELLSTNITDCMTSVAANGQPVAFSVQPNVMINDANITLTDVISSNGIIHVIDKVLTPTDNPNDIPRTAQCTGIHDSLVAGVVQAELLETLQGPGPFTVFAPTDQAFADAGIDLGALDNPAGKQTLSDILLYHVVSGEVPSSNVTECMTATAVNGQTLSFTVSGGVMVNGANVTVPDVATSNGVIHVIDKVLTPTDTPNDIPRTAQCTGIHDSLVSAVVQAELLETLQGTGPFTLFAPTDQAFADAGIDLASLDNPAGKETLTDILLYHVVSGNVPSSALSDCMTAPAVNGQTLSFNLGSGVMVNDANVTLADVGTSNGVIHVIDKVLMPTDTPNDIPRTAECSGVHNSLVSSIVQAELLETLQGDGPFTVFAPTDQAFADAGIDLAALDNPDGKQTLTDILLYHVVAGAVPAANVTDCMSASTVNGNPLSFTVGGTVMVNGATVTATDLAASNGIIHVIDKVLMPTSTPNDIPRTAQCTGIHDSLVAAVIQAELLETLQGEGPFTVFAPTDQAFADAGIDLAAFDTVEGKAALSDILLYHVVSSEVPSSAVTDCMDATAANGQTLSFSVGSSVMVNDATVTMADVATSNGVIHVIDKVLSPTNTPNDIARTAQCTGVHSSLVAALAQAELVETLQGEGPFTVFAPTDQAFADAGIDLASFDTPEGKETLTDILLYHVVSGAVPAADVAECGSATAVNGQPLAFTVGDSVMINDATVSIADVNTSNGVIHVIDKVLMPTDTPNDTVRTASCTGAHTSLVAALIQAELVATLEGEGPFTVFAPSDQAFADAGIDLASFDSVSGKENLTDILLYHVYAGTFTAADINDGSTLQMVNGDNATISASPGINDAGIVTADVFTSNGVIHVIDKVLMPPVPEVEVPVDEENETNEGEGTGDGTSSDEDEDSGWMNYLYIGLGILVLAGVGGLLFLRRGEAGGDISKDFAQGGVSNPMSMNEGTIFTAQPSSGQTTTTSYATQIQATYPTQTVTAAQPTYQAQAVAQPVVEPVVAQPVVAEPQVLQQWTDDAGHTWRQMDDGSMLWWNGTDWQPAA